MANTQRLVPRTLAAQRASRAIRSIAFVAIAAIGLGFLMQGLIVLARLLAGGALPGAGLVADLASTVSWSVLVCTGVAIGVSLGKARAALAGLIGLVFAPIGLAAAKGAQKFVAAMVEVSTAPALLSVEVVGAVRALEYGLLAFVLVILAERKESRLLPYLGTGAGVGLVFGGFLSLMTLLASSLDGAGRSWPLIAGTLTSELGFPIGCALLIYVGQLITDSFRDVKMGSTPMGPQPSAA